MQEISAPSSHSVALVAEDFATWRTIVSESFVPLDVKTDSEDNFKAQIRMRSLGDVFVSDIGARSHSVERTPSLIGHDDKRYFKLSLQLAGTGLLMQDGREAVLHPGDLAIYDTDRPYTLAFESDFRSLVVMVPQTVFDLPRDVVGQMTATRISGDQGLARIVGPFLTQMAKNMDELTGHSGVRLMNNALDLITTLLHGELDSENVALGASHRSSLLQEIRAYIDDNLGDPHLSPGAIAAANFISTRHLHGIFKKEGVTVSAWIRSRRLEHCRRELSDPLFINRPVSSIAIRWGFVDASHFSRLFRATFGEAPTVFRNRIWPEAVNR
jgi:AraC-like DNA-binding protein